MRVCIGIICIGEKYIYEFESLFKPSIAAYCQKYGYDLKIFDSYLDETHAYPDCISFQKCLVPDALREYDRVMVLDADIWINETAPPIHTYNLNGKIAIADEVAQVSKVVYKTIGNTSDPIDYYKLAGFTIHTDSILNTGCMICDSPQILKDIYWKYIDNANGHPRRFHYEQACIGYELQTKNLYIPLTNMWNWLYVLNSALRTSIPENVYAIHFAGIGHQNSKYALDYFLNAVQRTKRLLRWGIHK